MKPSSTKDEKSKSNWMRENEREKKGKNGTGKKSGKKIEGNEQKRDARMTKSKEIGKEREREKKND